MARHQRLLPRRRERVSDVLPQQSRRRGSGKHVGLPRHHAARASRELGRFTAGLSADRALQMVELARLVWSGARRQVERRRGCRAGDADVIVLAHIGAVPVEEMLAPLASGAGAGTVIWLAALLRRALRRRR